MPNNVNKNHKYKDPATYTGNKAVGRGSKTDTYHGWKRDGVLNDKLILIEGYARDGATEKNISEALGISQNTLINMKKEYPDIGNALRKGKEIVDYAVENALLRRALGGDVQAITFWLKNRRPDKWRDLKELNASLQDGFINFDFTGIVGEIGDKGKLELEMDTEVITVKGE